MRDAAERLIIALDDLDFDASLRLVEKTSRYAKTFKVGLSLFSQCGPQVVKEIKALGVDVFLDLKLHDIPMQVKKAIENVMPLAPRFLTVHAMGGGAMLREAQTAANEKTTTVLAVSVLTSLNNFEFAQIGFQKNIDQGASDLTSLAFSSGIRGFVCSPHEVSALKKTYGNSCTFVCPGVRHAGAELHDQARVMSARDAIIAGADVLVVGRPITKAANVSESAHALCEEISSAIATPLTKEKYV